jgi:hypothetical protein
MIPDDGEDRLLDFPLQWVPDFVSFRVKLPERETSEE